MKAINIILSLAIMFAVNNASAQYRNNFPINGNYLQIGIESAITGSGHGSTTIYKTHYGVRHWNVGVGLIMQNDYKTFSGASLEFNYVITCHNGINLYFNSTTNGYYMSQLGENLIIRTHRADYLADYTSGKADLEKFNSLESFIGFGLIKTFGDNFGIKAGVGIGGYYNQIQSPDHRDLSSIYTQDCGAALNLKIGAFFQL